MKWDQEIPQVAVGKNNYDFKIILKWFYNPLKNAWARIYFQTSGSKTEYEADSFIGSAKIDFLVRYDESITIKDYIVYRGDNYYIQEVQELGRKEGLKLKTIKKEDIN